MSATRISPKNGRIWLRTRSRFLSRVAGFQRRRTSTRAESHESSHRFSCKVATHSHQSSHPFGAAGFGETECAVLPLGFSRLVRGGCDGAGKVGDEKGEEDSCVSFRRGPQRSCDRDPLRSCAALGGADPGAVRCLRAELAGGPAIWTRRSWRRRSIGYPGLRIGRRWTGRRSRKTCPAAA